MSTSSQSWLLCASRALQPWARSRLKGQHCPFHSCNVDVCVTDKLMVKLAALHKQEVNVMRNSASSSAFLCRIDIL